MGARLAAALCVVISGAVVEPWAAEPGRDDASVSPAASREARIEPWIHPSMPEGARSRLEAGFELAVERVRDVDPCAQLFTRLGADGLEMLSTGLYFPVDGFRREVEVCGRNPATSSAGGDTFAYTTVGGAPTFVCRHFARASVETAAVVVIHEALHHAGLAERPHDRLAMSSLEITEMVKHACGF